MRFLLFPFVFATSISFGQQMIRSSLTTSTSNSNGFGVYVSSTIGEPLVSNFSKPSGQLRQGFEQTLAMDIDAEGCTDESACNYYSLAVIDNGTCEYVSCLIGCTDSAACNYNPDVIADDGSCDYSCCPGPGCCGSGTVWFPDLGMCAFESCFADLNGDGYRGTVDLLLVLSVYGTGCE